MDYINQHQMIVDYIRINGSITAADAFADLGITCLPSRISELRKMGYPILIKIEKGVNRFGKPVRYHRYYIDSD